MSQRLCVEPRVGNIEQRVNNEMLVGRKGEQKETERSDFWRDAVKTRARRASVFLWTIRRGMWRAAPVLALKIRPM
jgi:hypothetical protein